MHLGFFSKRITLADLEKSDFVKYSNEDILARSIDLDVGYEHTVTKLKVTTGANPR